MVSVIVPIYKVEKYLRSCVDSILQQTFSDIEIILVDDGSPDGCGAICEEYAQKDKRVRVIHKENGGLSDARNAGLDVCRGDYIVFVDSDDCIHPQMIEKLYQYCEKYEADLAICEFQEFQEGTQPDRKILRDEIPDVKIIEKTEIMTQLKSRNLITVVAWNKLYKAPLFTSLRYKKGYLHEDEFLIHQILQKCNRIVYTNERLYYYLRREGSITGRISMKYIQDELKAYQERVEFLERNSYTEMKIETQKQILHKIIYYWPYMCNSDEGRELYEKLKRIFEKYFSDADVKKALTSTQVREYEIFQKNEKKYFRNIRKNEIKENIKSMLRTLLKK